MIQMHRNWYKQENNDQEYVKFSFCIYGWEIYSMKAWGMIMCSIEPHELFLSSACIPQQIGQILVCVCGCVLVYDEWHHFIQCLWDVDRD